jgi:hypothetical protein
MCSPNEEINSFILGNDVIFDDGGPSDFQDWHHNNNNACYDITFEDGECIQHIDSVFFSSYGLEGLTFTTNHGNTDHLVWGAMGDIDEMRTRD